MATAPPPQKVDDVSDAVERAKALHRQGAHHAHGGQARGIHPDSGADAVGAKRGKTFADCMQDDALLKQFCKTRTTGCSGSGRAL
jgi:hypothetical protein